MMSGQAPWVSFCISTYRRPAFIHSQVKSLLQQTFSDFEIIISDNDPDGSALAAISYFEDTRIKYFHNSENLGMIKSFNKSIERAIGEYVVMVTDDDPIETNFLSAMYRLTKSYPGLSMYGGFIRKGFGLDDTHVISKDVFVEEILDPDRTLWFLWSSCIVNRNVAIACGMIPDYGSPHLADHAFIARAGRVSGAAIVNRAYSSLSSHDANFSKFNFEYYVKGCKGFYDLLFPLANNPREAKIIKKHLNIWFITSMFNLKRYYTLNSNTGYLGEVEKCARQILHMDFMHSARWRFAAKNFVFKIKAALNLL